MSVGYVSKTNRGARYKISTLIQDILGKETIHKEMPQGRKNLYVLQGDTCKFWEKAVQRKTPYILIESDVRSWARGGPESIPWEIDMIENARGVIFSSVHHLNYCLRSGYKVPPSIIINNKPLIRDIKNIRVKKPGKGNRLVYTGGVVELKFRKSQYGYRSYHEIFQKLGEKGWEVHIYNPLGERCLGGYEQIGCKIHEAVPQSEIYKELAKYDAGFQGYNYHEVDLAAVDYVKHCLPNKIWEYLGAGIPTLGYQTGKGGKIYHKKWGIVMKRIVGPEKVKFPIITEKIRGAEVIDHNKRRLEGFLEDIHVA